MRKGFTLIELMIVIAIIAIIAAIAIPNLLESRITANEAAASASLKAAIFAGEVQFQGGAYQDGDQNGVGEYGPLNAMSGLMATSKTPAASLHLLTGPLATAVVGDGYVSNNNYFFCSQCPSTTTIATQATTAIWTESEKADPSGGAGTSLASATTSCQNGERYFCAGASPANYGNTGRRNFFISNDGMLRSPATVASDTIWLGAAPKNNIIPTAATMILGLADAYGAKAKWPTAADGGVTPGYPVFSK